METEKTTLQESTSEMRNAGRPKIYANAAEKQKAYRERLKAKGLREIKRIVRDVREPKPLHSDIIDLSEVRRW